MIRLIITLIFVVLFLLVSLILQPLMLLIGLFSRRARDVVSLAIVNWAFRVVLFCAGTKATVSGEENVPKDEAVLYILNHNSYFDILLTYIRVPRPTGYVAKKEMLRFFTLTWWMKLLHCEFLDRKDLRAGMKTINDSAEKIKNGISMAIFPEGTRRRKEEEQLMLPFHGGSFKIAEKSDCKIVPVVLRGSSAIFEDHIPLLKKAHVDIQYLPPIDVGAMDREQRRDLPDIVRERMLEAYEAMIAAESEA
ncbi:MAG: 1-acyl-sn-glycerol-3-phosphate acyltransferase [Lachnospiraceae bacterium]|nr:1-acyl-sn-glycerol-3-phosphate acyltransferase [Lachnospiraceae bacterium]